MVSQARPEDTMVCFEGASMVLTSISRLRSTRLWPLKGTPPWQADGGHQLIQGMLAEAATELTPRLLVYRAFNLIDHGAQRGAAMPWYATEMAVNDLKALQFTVPATV